MALSGSFQTNVGAGWRLRLEWSAKQNIANNTSTITTKLYWMSLGSSYTVNSSASKSGSSTIDGTASSFSGTNLAKLTGNQKKLIKTHSKTVTHNSNGTKSVNLSAYFDAEVTLSGTYYGRINVSGTATLNTIPRGSTMTTNRNWTAGSNKTITVSRHSTSFNHIVDIAVQNSSSTWVTIKSLSFSTSQTSLSSSFSVANNNAIFNALNGRASAPSRMILRTRSGTTEIASTTYTGTVTAPVASTANSSSANFNIGASVPVTITRANSSFTHTIRFYVGGTLIRTETGVTTSRTWTPTTANNTEMYAKTPNSTSVATRIEVDTFYDGRKVRSTTSRTGTAKVVNSNPTFTASQISYDDTNTTTVGITGNNQYIIQGRSTFRARIISGATARNGASMKEYIITVNGVSKTQTTTGYNTFGSVSASSNVTMTVKAVDSRGLSTTASKTVTIVPYKEPVVHTSSARLNGFENSTTITLSGSISPLSVGGANKNSVASARYQYRQQGTGSYSALTAFTVTSTLPTYRGANRTVSLDNQKAWDVRVIVTDKIGSTTIDVVVPVGRPILFMDSVKKSIGFNDFPSGEGEFMVNGKIVFGANQYATSSGEGFGALHMNNSDITGANGIWFNDVSNNNGEGLQFIKTGSPVGSGTQSHYDNFRILDGRALLNGRPVFSSEIEVLWSGAIYMQATQTITPSRAITNCPTGWILVWSAYSSGSASNDNWHFTFVPRAWQQARSGGGGIQMPLGNSGTHFAKYIYITNTTISGHERNNTAPFNTRVLRYVISY